MRARAGAVLAWARALVCAGLCAGCADRGRVDFRIDPPANPLLDPLSERVTDYTIKRTDGTVVAVASESATRTGDLALGALMPTMGKVDLSVTLSSGGTLLGQARLRDVTIVGGQDTTVDVPVRKPLLVVGSSAAPEGTGALSPPELIDGVSLSDLTQQGGAGAPAPMVPTGITAAAFSWDGRFLFTSTANGLHVMDTGTGVELGVAPLPFAATRLAVSTRDAALAALAPGGGTSQAQVAIFPDLAALTANPSSNGPTTLIPLGTQAPRRLLFSRDGSRLYVLDGGNVDDPCTAMTPPAANKILVFDPRDGSSQGSWTLPGFVSDFAMDPASGALVLSDTTNQRVSLLDESSPTGAASPRTLGTAVCPSAVRVAGGNALVVTSENGADAATFVLQRIPLGATGAAKKLPFGAPSYQVAAQIGGGVNPRIGATLAFLPLNLVATDLALTPDGTRAVFSTRAWYHERLSKFRILDYDCTADYDLVEYGEYVVDTGTGNASYVLRSQWVTYTKTKDTCATCDNGFSGIDVPCSNEAGDRATGLAASFGGP